MWGGGLAFSYTKSVLDAQANAFSAFMNPENFDDAADMGVALVFQNPGGSYAVGNSLFYTKPVANPPIYQPFTSIPSPLGTSLGNIDVGAMVLEASGVLPANASR